MYLNNIKKEIFQLYLRKVYKGLNLTLNTSILLYVEHSKMKISNTIVWVQWERKKIDW